MKEFTKEKKKAIRLSGVGLSLVLFLIFAVTEKSQAQLYPLGTVYFDNQYMVNPALAGIEEGLRVNLSFRKQWSDIPGSPTTQNITGDYGHNRIGLGLNLSNDLEGLLHNTRIVGTYAYHLPLNSQQDKLHVAVSVGFINQRIRNEAIVGTPGDASVARFNERRNYIDGDFGIAYASNNFAVQAAVPNLKSYFKKDFNRLADLAVFYTALSYKINMSGGVNAMAMEPKICYRGVKGVDNMWDGGSNFSFSNDRINLMAMYHSIGNATFGFGFNYDAKWKLSSNYTTPSSALKAYTSTGDFEVSIKRSF